MIEKFWKAYLDKNSSGGSYKSAICFGSNLDQAQAAVDAILQGKKTMDIYPAEGYRNSMCGSANADDLNVVIDWNNAPCAVIRTLEVCEITLAEITDEICNADGSMNAEAWREEKLPAIKLEIEELGGELKPESKLVLERFTCVYPA